MVKKSEFEDTHEAADDNVENPPDRYFICSECGGSQRYASADEVGGITVEEAEGIGWLRVSGDLWVCPMCRNGPRAERKE